MLFTHFYLATEKVYGRVVFVRACAGLAASARTGDRHPMRVGGFVFSLGIILRMRRWRQHSFIPEHGFDFKLYQLVVQPKIHYGLGRLIPKK